MGGSIFHERKPAKWLTFILAFTFFDTALLQVSFGEDMVNIATLLDKRFYINLFRQEPTISHFDLKKLWMKREQGWFRTRVSLKMTS